MAGWGKPLRQTGSPSDVEHSAYCGSGFAERWTWLAKAPRGRSHLHRCWHRWREGVMFLWTGSHSWSLLRWYIWDIPPPVPGSCAWWEHTPHSLACVSYTDGAFHSHVLLPAACIVAFWTTTLKTRRHQSQMFQLRSGSQGLKCSSTYQKYRRCWALSGVFAPRFQVHSMVIML